MHTTMLGKMGPPYAMMPSYMTAFQSSPVRICQEGEEPRVERQKGEVPTQTSAELGEAHLEAGEQSLREGVERAPLHLGLVKVEFASEQLHSQQGEDDEEEEEQQQKGADGFHGVEQRVHQVGQGGPVASDTTETQHEGGIFNRLLLSSAPCWATSQKRRNHRVILKILSRRMQRSTAMPMGGMTSSSTSSISRMPPHTTKQSKRLKRAMK